MWSTYTRVYKQIFRGYEQYRFLQNTPFKTSTSDGVMVSELVKQTIATEFNSYNVLHTLCIKLSLVIIC